MQQTSVLILIYVKKTTVKNNYTVKKINLDGKNKLGKLTMAGREVVRKTLQQVRPILSVDNDEARRRVLSLYKAWYRQIPYVGE